MEKSSYAYAELESASSHEENASGRRGNSTITRSLPLVNIFGKRGFFLFSSKQSYDKFKVTKFKDAKLDADGVGVPLFHLVTKYDIMAHVSSKKPVYVIYKYVLNEVQSFPPHAQGEIFLQDDTYCLYKVLFCEVYKSGGFTKATYKMRFPFESTGTREDKLLENKCSEGFKATFDGNKLLWDTTTENNFSFSYDLRLEESSSSDPTSNVLPVSEPGATIGSYHPNRSGWIPKKMFNCAELRITEKSPPTEKSLSTEKSLPTALGRVSVPSITEVLACHGMLLHRIEEDRKQARYAMCCNYNNHTCPFMSRSSGEFS